MANYPAPEIFAASLSGYPATPVVALVPVGLLARQQEEQRSGERPFSKAPVWNFVVPPMLGSQMIQMGCLLPGRDSVGRHYPVCLQLSFTPAEWSSRLLGQAESWYQQLGRLGLHAVRNSYSASQLDEMLMTIPAPQPVEPQKRSDILDVIGYDDEGQSTLGWRRRRSVLIRCARPATGGQTAATAIRCTPTSTAETSPGSSLRCCSIRQAAPVRAATVFTRLCLNKQDLMNIDEFLAR